jgi:NhaA family Na+:H+ antiporter
VSSRPPRIILIKPLRDFLATESAGGIAIVVAAIVALVWANSAWQASYHVFWATEFEVRLGSASLALDLREWVNEGLMAIFFLVVGLEIKREVVEGELRDGSRRALPVFAAIGGMIVPALIYLAMNYRSPESQGWGIPMATDIALAVGLITLARGVRPGLKVFLLTLAIVDDIGAIVVVAVLGASSIQVGWIAVACVSVAALVMLMWRADLLWVYLLVGGVLWIALFEAGIHATLAGVILGLLAPTTPYLPPELIDQDELTNVGSAREALVTTRMARSSASVLEWLEYRLHPWTSFLIVPVFALANAGISLSADTVNSAISSPVTWGVFLGLVVGKPFGILLASWLAVRSGIASLGGGLTWSEIGGAGLMAGIGFTVSLFIADVALPAIEAAHAKVGIFAASIVAGTLGLLVLRRLVRARPEQMGS